MTQLDMKAPTVQEQGLSSMGEAALVYAAQGWAVFPLKPREKRPLTEHGVHDATTNPEVIRAWWTRWPDANIGLACGASGLVVLDFDTDKDDFQGGELLERLRREHPTTTARTGGGGMHLLFRQPEGVELGNSRGRLPRGVDVRGHGGYIVLPPSLHPNGEGYRWEPETPPPASLPGFVLEMLRPKPEPKPQAVAARNGAGRTAYAQAALERELGRLARAQEGERNETLNKAAFALGQLVAGGELSRPEVEGGLLAAALECGLGEAEARRTLRSGLEAGMKEPRTPPARSPGKRPDRDVLVDIGLEHLAVFKDPAGTTYAAFDWEGHRETHRLKSEAVRAHLNELFHQVAGKWPGSQAMQDALNVLEGKAMRAPRRDVFLRAAHVDGVTWIDLGGPDWRAVRGDASGWQVVDRPEVRFRRVRNMRPMPVPQRGGTLEHLGELLHVDRSGLVMIAAWAIAALSGRGPFPVLVVVGEQGSAKSTTVRLLKELVDPAAGGLRGQHRDVNELMLAAFSSWLLAYDNVSTIPPDVSDALCRIATGGGYTKRALYTDAEEVVLDVMRPVALNGITDIVNRPDLMDRSIVVELPPLPEEKRVDEATYWRQVEETAPLALGFLLDALSHALRALPYTQLERSPRMADFARLAEAAAPMLGLEEGEFVRLYQANREESTATLVEGTVLAAPLRQLVAVSGEWTGTAAELLQTLNSIADESAKTARAWPRQPNRLSGELRRIAPALRAAGVVDIRPKKVQGKRLWTIQRLVS